MRIAYLDCFAGISGDMLLGALAGAGVPLAVMGEAVASLGLGASLEAETVDRSGISSLKVHVLEDGKAADGGLPEDKPQTNHSHAEAHSHAHVGHTHETHWHGQAEAAHSTPAAHSHAHAKAHSHSHTEAHSQAESGQSHAPHAHGRSLSAIRELIRSASLAAGVKRRAIEAFELLGMSEAKIHNVPVERIHFHEVGAVDAIADIVGACAGIEHLGAVVWHASPVNVGSGMVQCAHGTFPVPAPATADLLRGIPTYAAHVEKELVTPTGAALLRMLAPRFGPQPPMEATSIGYGAGSRNPPGFPNVLRLTMGTSSASARETVTVLEAALDDASPQLIAYAAEQALAQGALDVMLTPVVMKKGRPGTLMTVLTRPGDADALAALLLKETTTLGLRRRTEERQVLDREHVTVATEYGPVRVKVGSLDGERLNAAAEYEDCRAAAARNGAALKEVQRAALAGLGRG